MGVMSMQANAQDRLQDWTSSYQEKGYITGCGKGSEFLSSFQAAIINAAKNVTNKNKLVSGVEVSNNDGYAITAQSTLAVKASVEVVDQVTWEGKTCIAGTFR